MRLATSSLLLLGAFGAQASVVLSSLSSNLEQRALSHSEASSRLLAKSFHGKDSGKKVPSYRVPLLSLHRALVNVPSISQSEGEVGLLLKDLLTDLNYTVSLQQVPLDDPNEDAPPRYNVIAWPDSGANRTLNNRVLITTHIDVVPPYIPYGINNKTIPPTDTVDFARLAPTAYISGRGSVDAKASVATQVTAATALLEAGDIPRDSVVLVFVVSEEISGKGLGYFSDSLSNTTEYPAGRPQLKASIHGEPTWNKLACGHKGGTGGWITARGKAGHSGYPEQGKSATAVLIRALDRLLDADLGSSEQFGNTTVNVGILEGGVAGNVIAPEARARVSVRVAVGNQTTGADIVTERIEKLLSEVDDELELDFSQGNGPVKFACDIDGFETVIANYGTDVPKLEGDHPRYLYGPGSILVAHADHEGLTVKDLEDAVEGYKRLIKHVVGAE
ncbi:hypothetical protein VTI28DRAFT_9197 [Corynascus sepedonium]